jgi:hypothetical protein
VFTQCREGSTNDLRKSKRLPYTAKFIREVIPGAEEKANRKAAAFFGVDEIKVRLWRKHNAAISGCESSRTKHTRPTKGLFPESGDSVFKFFQETSKNGLFVSYDLLHEAVIKKARSFSTPQSHFKASK